MNRKNTKGQSPPHSGWALVPSQWQCRRIWRRRDDLGLQGFDLGTFEERRVGVALERVMPIAICWRLWEVVVTSPGWRSKMRVSLSHVECRWTSALRLWRQGVVVAVVQGSVDGDAPNPRKLICHPHTTSFSALRVDGASTREVAWELLFFGGDRCRSRSGALFSLGHALLCRSGFVFDGSLWTSLVVEFVLLALPILPSMKIRYVFGVLPRKHNYDMYQSL
jgi:hypothetical protein